MKFATTAIIAAMSVQQAAGLRSVSVNQEERRLAVTVPSDHMVSMTEKVKYQCTVSASWSAENHPVDYPADAHTSPPVLVAHNANYKMFTPGSAVSPGVKLVAETGNPETLIEELAAAGSDVMSYIVGVPMFFGPKIEEDVAVEMTSTGGVRRLAEGNATKVKEGGDAIFETRAQTLEATLIFTPEHDKFTSISMLAPSPDWFSSSHGTSAIDGDVWLKSFKYETLPYDAGTDSGVTFKSEDVATDPVGVATMFTTENTQGGIFLNADGTDILPVYGWECSIAEVMYKCEFDPACDDGTSAAGAHTVMSGIFASALAGAYFVLM